jgi:hypothetical protein
MPGTKQRGTTPLPDQVLFCHPDVVRDHTARLASMEKRLVEVAQNQSEVLVLCQSLGEQLGMRNAALDRLLTRLSLGDSGLRLRETREQPAIFESTDPKEGPSR